MMCFTTLRFPNHERRVGDFFFVGSPVIMESLALMFDFGQEALFALDNKTGEVDGNRSLYLKCKGLRSIHDFYELYLDSRALFSGGSCRKCNASDKVQRLFRHGTAEGRRPNMEGDYLITRTFHSQVRKHLKIELAEFRRLRLATKGTWAEIVANANPDAIEERVRQLEDDDERTSRAAADLMFEAGSIPLIGEMHPKESFESSAQLIAKAKIATNPRAKRREAIAKKKSEAANVDFALFYTNYKKWKRAVKKARRCRK